MEKTKVITIKEVGGTLRQAMVTEGQLIEILSDFKNKRILRAKDTEGRVIYFNPDLIVEICIQEGE
jgi:hypothetical protein